MSVTWGSAEGLQRYAKLIMRDEYNVSSSEASANAITLRRPFSEVKRVWLNGTQTTSYTATAPRTLSFTSLTEGDSIIVEYVDASVPSDTVTEYLSRARAYIEARVTSAGYDPTVVTTGDLLDMLVEKYGAAELLMAEISRERQNVQDYPTSLMEWVESTLAKIDSGTISLIDDTGTEQTPSTRVVSYNYTGSSVFRDEDGDWDEAKW